MTGTFIFFLFPALYDQFDLSLHTLHATDTVVDDDDLTIASELMLDRPRDHRFVPFGDDGFDRFFPRGRCREYGYLLES